MLLGLVLYLRSHEIRELTVWQCCASGRGQRALRRRLRSYSRSVLEGVLRLLSAFAKKRPSEFGAFFKPPPVIVRTIQRVSWRFTCLQCFIDKRGPGYSNQMGAEKIKTAQAVASVDSKLVDLEVVIKISVG